MEARWLIMRIQLLSVRWSGNSNLNRIIRGDFIGHL